MAPVCLLDGTFFPVHPSTCDFSTVNVTINGSLVYDSATPSNSISAPGSILPGSARIELQGHIRRVRIARSPAPVPWAASPASSTPASLEFVHALRRRRAAPRPSYCSRNKPRRRDACQLRRDLFHSASIGLALAAASSASIFCFLDIRLALDLKPGGGSALDLRCRHQLIQPFV